MWKFEGEENKSIIQFMKCSKTKIEYEDISRIDKITMLFFVYFNIHMY